MCCLCRTSRCWRTASNCTVGGRGKRKNNSDCSFRLRFLDTGKRRHVPNSDLSRQQVWSNGSCERKRRTAYSISFLVGFIRDLGFGRIILKWDNEPSTKALHDAVIHACVGVKVIPQGPPEGDHMANGRVEMAVREVKRQCRTLRISAEHNTGVRIADDSPLLSWLPRFAAQVMNKMRIGKDGKTSE